MTVSVVATFTAYQANTNTGSIALSFTPTAGNLLVGFLTIANSTGPATIVDSNYTWVGVMTNTSGASAPMDHAWVFITTATAATQIDATGSYSLNAGTGGRSRLNVFELGNHAGYGSVVSTFSSASTTLLSVNIVTTANNAAVVTGHHSNTLETNKPATFTGYGSYSTSGPALSFNWAANPDMGVAGTYAVQWGSNPGTSMDRRKTTAVVILPSATVTFDYNLLEHRVMRGAGRGVMRGVA